MDELQSPAPPTPPYAGFWLRAGAALLDTSSLFVISFPVLFVTIVAYTLLRARKETDATLAVLCFFLCSEFLVFLLYFALQESSAWQATLGKKVLGLVVTDLHERRLTFWRAALRTLGKYLSNLTLGLGYLLCVFTSKKQTLHDLLTGCLVLLDKR